MANSLLTGISGLRGHQKMLEVVGNNLANLNTTAFKASRVIFSDLMYEVQRNSSSTTTGNLGSVNPVQIGTGSRVSQVDLNFQQGNLEATGNAFDVALDGGGFFVAMSGNSTSFTRAGVFSPDESGYLSEAATGNLIKRIGTVGEPDGINPSFQTSGDERINIPKGASIPGKITETITMSGNLPKNYKGDTAQKLVTPRFLDGGLSAALTTKLSDLDLNTANYVTGDKLKISGMTSDGVTVDSELTIIGDPDPSPTTVGDLIAQLNTDFPGSTFALDTDGRITATANSTGPSLLNIQITDGESNSGQTDFDENDFVITDIGQVADKIFRSVQVYDASGVGHMVGLEFTKQTDESWNMKAIVAPTEGIALDEEVTGITFLQDGSFAQVTGTGLGDANITLQFNGLVNPQTVDFSFAAAGTSGGLTQRGGASISGAIARADGFPPGELSEFNIDTDGIIYGLATNGVRVEVAQLAIASFRNIDGLVSVGGNYYQASLASGDPEIGTAQSGDRGTVRSGQLEGSNVDLALEFTRLIIAQRGFSANARTITVTDQVLQELTSIIR